MTLFTPPEYADPGKAVVFLAGPIQGAPDWQADAIGMIRLTAPELQIASPRRPVATSGDFSEVMYQEQVLWEHHHLEHGAACGAILFWLASEADHRCDRSYAQTTRLELGIALGWSLFRKSRIVVGIEAGFSNERYIRYTLGVKYPDVPIFDDLERTCAAAAAAARSVHA